MRVSMLLADAAQAVDGKLYLLGGGLTTLGSQPFAIALVMELDREQLGTQQHLRLDVVDEDGDFVPGPEQGRLHVEIGFRFAAPPEADPPTPLNYVYAINLGSQPTLAPGRSYRWRLTLNGHHDPDWVLPFTTEPARS